MIDIPLLDTRRGKDLMGTFLADIVLQVHLLRFHLQSLTLRFPFLFRVALVVSSLFYIYFASLTMCNTACRADRLLSLHLLHLIAFMPLL